MIDLHTHSFFSDGDLCPSELVRRAQHKGYTAIAITDHVDSSNLDFVVPRIVKVAKVLNRYWDIMVIPGAELTHVPIQEIQPLTKLARKFGAKIVICHGETISEPVLPGTNRRAIEAGVNILAHPGLISKGDAELARKRKVYLELTTRKLHSRTNKHLIKVARQTGAALVLNNDAHSEEDFVTEAEARRILTSGGLNNREIAAIFEASKNIIKGLKNI